MGGSGLQLLIALPMRESLLTEIYLISLYLIRTTV